MKLKPILNVLGALITLLGTTMIIPILISYFSKGIDLVGLVKSSLICILIGFPLWFFTKHKKSLNNKIGFAIVTLSWVTAAFAGSLPFYLTGTIPNFTDAFFESMSGVTTTGATILGNPITLANLPNGIESLPRGVLFWRSFIQWVGGMGIIVFYIAILPVLGSGGIQLFKLEVPGPVADKLKPRLRDTAKMLWFVYFSFTLVQIILLTIAGMPFFDSVCHGLTTMPTGGFSTQNESIGAYTSDLIHYIIIAFMFIAGINFTLHFKALTGNIKAHIKDYEFRVYALIVLISTLLIFFNISSINSEYTHDNFLKSLFQSLALLTGTGYTSANYELWPFFSQHLLLILMFLGAMGGSTSGGMKIARIILLIKSAITETRRMLHARAIIPIKIGKRIISDEIVRNTLGFSLIYISVFIITSLALSFFNLDLQSAVGAAASAIGNVGPAFGEFGPTDNYSTLHPMGKWLLSFCMLLGRLEIFAVIVLLSAAYWK
ncbi:MAG: TrkH family potassium uptake protein [Candidatus Neomarinimicrobiota bacterium]